MPPGIFSSLFILPLEALPAPKCFVRLDKYIRLNGLRALDVFKSLDVSGSKCVQYQDLADGLTHIGFRTSMREKQELKDWLEQRQGLYFRDFTLALKQRASISSGRK